MASVDQARRSGARDLEGLALPDLNDLVILRVDHHLGLVIDGDGGQVPGIERDIRRKLADEPHQQAGAYQRADRLDSLGRVGAGERRQHMRGVYSGTPTVSLVMGSLRWPRWPR